MNLKFCMRSAYDEGFVDHPQQVMSDLGITYLHATPQSIGDQWWFWCCEGIPTPLPDFIKPLNVSPKDCIGFGLDKETALKIEEYYSNE